MLSLLARVQGRFIYFPRRYRTVDLEQARANGVEELSFTTSQGEQTAFFWHKTESGSALRNIWLVFGGNGTLALEWLSFFVEFADPRSGVLLVDYPGYGVCEGEPDPKTILENSQTALAALLANKRWKPGTNTLFAFGHSLGGAAAFQFAVTHRVEKIVAVSTFTTMDAMVRATIRISLGQLLQHRFDNMVSLKAILARKEAPEIYIFHGELDELVPVEMGRTLAQLDPSRIRFVAVPAARHNDVIEKALPLGLRSALRSY
jgi:pimeloyl-ACP methyl ester carboxylesterase